MPLIIAHRGTNPENKMEGFMNAYRDGCTTFECDVRLSKDGIPVVIHDAKIDRTTEGKGFVSCMTSERLMGYGVPRFEDLAAFIKHDPSLKLVVELKALGLWWKNKKMVKRVIDVMEKYGISHQCMMISFSPQILKYVRCASEAMGKHIHYGFLYGPSKGMTGCCAECSVVNLAMKYQADSLWLHHTMIDEVVAKECSKQDIRLYTWTVNSIKDMVRLHRLGITIDGVVTDYPHCVVGF
jgi:glycerophosphoryl diester phosphodiesterase